MPRAQYCAAAESGCGGRSGSRRGRAGWHHEPCADAVSLFVRVEGVACTKRRHGRLEAAPRDGDRPTPGEIEHAEHGVCPVAGCHGPLSRDVVVAVHSGNDDPLLNRRQRVRRSSSSAQHGRCRPQNGCTSETRKWMKAARRNGVSSVRYISKPRSSVPTTASGRTNSTAPTRFGVVLNRPGAASGRWARMAAWRSRRRSRKS